MNMTRGKGKGKGKGEGGRGEGVTEEDWVDWEGFPHRGLPFLKCEFS